jgi:hypothetical protein
MLTNYKNHGFKTYTSTTNTQNPKKKFAIFVWSKEETCKTTLCILKLHYNGRSNVNPSKNNWKKQLTWEVLECYSLSYSICAKQLIYVRYKA